MLNDSALLETIGLKKPQQPAPHFVIAVKNELYRAGKVGYRPLF
jgi:hypothetical protein